MLLRFIVKNSIFASMKNSIIYIFSLLSITIIAAACSTDFKVGADYKDYTVVFGLLSRNDTAHYMKITKGFYDENKSNLLVAQNVDSLYFNNIEVTMYKYTGLNAVDSIKLQKVDLNLEGYYKDSGIFVNTPNYAYKFKELLDPLKKYKLVVKNLNTGKIVYGETDVLDNSKIVFSRPISGDKLNFAQVGVSFTNFTWNTPANVSIFDLYLRFKYEEKNTAFTPVKITSVVKLIPLAKSVPNDNSPMNISVSAEDFYRALQGEIAPAGNNLTRFLDTPDVVVAAAGQELKTYIDVTSSQGGITYDQIKPFYTNMKGENVLGLFSSRATANSNQIQFSTATHDSILFGSFTKALKFVGNSSK
jgi:hypothetical protein